MSEPFTGFRLYRDAEDVVHLDQIVDDSVHPLEPDAADEKLEPGFYSTDMKRVADPYV